MNPKTFGSKVVERFRKQFPQLIFCRKVLSRGGKYYTIDYTIKSNDSYLGYLVVYKNYSVGLFLDMSTKCIFAKRPKDRIKISQMLYEKCVELGL